jgi:hypothetical protein
VRLSGYTSYFVAVELRGACLKDGGSKQTIQLHSDQTVDMPLTMWPLAPGAQLPCDLDGWVRLELAGKVDPAFKLEAPTTFEGLQRIEFKTKLNP